MNRTSVIFVALLIFAHTGSAAQPAAPSFDGAAIGPTLFRDIARETNRSVVAIMARSRGHGWGEDEESLFRMFGVEPPESEDTIQRLLGSGFVISTTGEILTSNHIVEGAETIEISLLGDDRRYQAILVGSDPITDTALVRLQDPPADLRSLTLGDSDGLEPGDWVMAIGNPFRLSHSVTVGFVSFNGRPVQVEEGRWQGLIQTSISINPGNSGGPLVDVRGEAVGINVAILDSDTNGNLGIGFAVPINAVRALLPQLRRGRVVRGHVGAQFHEGPIRSDEAKQLDLPTAAGAIVKAVDEGSEAERAGLRPGDVIRAIDGRSVADTRKLADDIASIAPGTRVHFSVFRNGAGLSLAATIEALPSPVETLPRTSGPTADVDGLTLTELTPHRRSRLSIPAVVKGALVVDVMMDSAADDASLAIGDVIRAINRKAVHSAAEAIAELRRIDPQAPIFLLVWRQGTELFLLMRKD